MSLGSAQCFLGELGGWGPQVISASILCFIAAGKIEKMAETARENNLFESIMKVYIHNVKHYKKEKGWRLRNPCLVS